MGMRQQQGARQDTMATATFLARGDSSTANNAVLNAQNTNTTPITEITFSSGTNGDLRLEPNGGAADPDTTIIINGVEMTFTVEFSGFLPNSNKLKDVNGVDLRGEPIAVITTETGQRLFFLPDGIDPATLDAFPNGAHDLEGYSEVAIVPVCFVSGTSILTSEGPRAIEHLKVGDMIRVGEAEYAPVRWMARRTVKFEEMLADQRLRPVCIRANAVAPGVPEADLWLSSGHRVALGGWQAELLFQHREVFVPAASFARLDLRPRSEFLSGVTYHHLMFDRHEIVMANGMPSESLFPGDMALASLTRADHAALADLFPQYGDDWRGYGPTARPSLSRREGEILLNALGIDGAAKLGDRALAA